MTSSPRKAGCSTFNRFFQHRSGQTGSGPADPRPAAATPAPAVPAAEAQASRADPIDFFFTISVGPAERPVVRESAFAVPTPAPVEAHPSAIDLVDPIHSFDPAPDLAAASPGRPSWRLASPSG